jgi:hypothetical protein
MVFDAGFGFFDSASTLAPSLLPERSQPIRADQNSVQEAGVRPRHWTTTFDCSVPPAAPAKTALVPLQNTGAA